jgi:hypothetical protein
MCSSVSPGIAIIAPGIHARWRLLALDTRTRCGYLGFMCILRLGVTFRPSSASSDHEGFTIQLVGALCIETAREGHLGTEFHQEASRVV